MKMYRVVLQTKRKEKIVLLKEETVLPDLKLIILSPNELYSLFCKHLNYT